MSTKPEQRMRLKWVRVMFADEQVVRVLARVVGDWAWHRTIYRQKGDKDGGWRVTHVPSSMRIPNVFTHKQARELTYLLTSRLPSVSCALGDTPPIKFCTKARDTYNEFMKEVENG